MVILIMFYLNINYLFLIIFCEWGIWLSKIGLTALKIGSVGSIKPPTYHLCRLKPTSEKNWNVCFKQILHTLIIESKPCFIVELVVLFIGGGKKVDKLATQICKGRVMVQLSIRTMVIPCLLPLWRNIFPKQWTGEVFPLDWLPDIRVLSS